MCEVHIRLIVFCSFSDISSLILLILVLLSLFSPPLPSSSSLLSFLFAFNQTNNVLKLHFLVFILFEGYCVYNGVYYKQGQTWDDGCKRRCQCMDVATGRYSCSQR